MFRATAAARSARGTTPPIDPFTAGLKQAMPHASTKFFVVYLYGFSGESKPSIVSYRFFVLAFRVFCRVCGSDISGPFSVNKIKGEFSETRVYNGLCLVLEGRAAGILPGQIV
jgi:hypothetical protein